MLNEVADDFSDTSPHPIKEFLQHHLPHNSTTPIHSMHPAAILDTLPGVRPHLATIHGR